MAVALDRVDDEVLLAEEQLEHPGGHNDEIGSKMIQDDPRKKTKRHLVSFAFLFLICE